MNAHDQDPRQQEAWDSLANLEDHPTMQDWLQQIDRAGPVLRRSARHYFSTAAASVIAVVSVAIITYFYFLPPRYETHVGEQREVLLPDGSRMTLNTNTLVTV